MRYRAHGVSALLVALSAVGCVGRGADRARRAAARACPPAPPDGWQAFALDSAAALAPRLAGTYDLVGVTTTRGMERGPRRVRMRLAVTDSAERSGVRGFGPDGRRLGFWDQPLTAYIDIAEQAPGWPRQYVYRLRSGALVQDERHLCLDCGATTYWLEAAGPSGLWGRWEHHFGGVAVKGRGGTWHTQVAGRFCAYRMANDSVPGG